MEETSKSKRGRKPKAKEEQVKVEEPKKVEETVKKEESKLPEPIASIPVVEEKVTMEQTGKEIGKKIEDVNIFELLWNSFINLFKK